MNWHKEPGSYCLGPDDPGLPTIGQVVATVQREWAEQRFPLAVSTVRTDPAPRTLIRFPTTFSARADTTKTIDTTILGNQVHIDASAEQWAWDFGDGATLTTTEPGRPLTDDITHAYAAKGRYATKVTVRWGGTFRIGGSPTEYPLRTPAFVPSTVGSVQVVAARSELVAQ